eukprot:scaffold75975_cov31-Phaeocystis_antarctica.AAC.1
MGALRRARPTAAERAGRVPRGALHAAAQGSRARRSTARELGILGRRCRFAHEKVWHRSQKRDILVRWTDTTARLAPTEESTPFLCSRPAFARSALRVIDRVSLRATAALLRLLRGGGRACLRAPRCSFSRRRRARSVGA